MAKDCPCCGGQIGPNDVACSYCGTAVERDDQMDINQQFYQTSNGATQVIQNIYVTNNPGSNTNFGGVNMGQQTNFNNYSTNAFSTKNRLVAALLALLFGWAGGQFFYLKKFGLGVICVMFMSTGIPALAGFIHAVSLFKMSDAEFAAKYP